MGSPTLSCWSTKLRRFPSFLWFVNWPRKVLQLRSRKVQFQFFIYKRIQVTSLKSRNIYTQVFAVLLQTFLLPIFSFWKRKTKKEERISEKKKKKEIEKKPLVTYIYSSIAVASLYQYSSIAHPCWRLRRWSRLGAKNRVGAEQSQTALLLLLLLLLLLPLLLLLLPRFHEFSAPREETQLILSTTFTITLSASATSSFFFVRWRSIQHRSLHSENCEGGRSSNLPNNATWRERAEREAMFGVGSKIFLRGVCHYELTLVHYVLHS